MAWIASGNYFGSPDYHLVFINVIYGLFVSLLYKILPSIEWYTILFLICHVISITILLCTVLRIRTNKTTKILIIAILYILETKMLMALQFTTTAGITATASLFLILSRDKKEMLIGLSLFILASLIRFHAAMLVGLVFLFFYPLYISLFKFHLLQFIILVIACVFATSFNLIDRVIYKTHPEWNYFYEYNKIRGKINDNPNAWRVSNNLPQNIHQDDVKLLTWYFFSDPNLLDLNTLKTIHATINEQTKYNNISSLKKIKNIPISLYDNLPSFIIIIPLYIYFLLGCYGKRKKLLYTSSFVGMLIIFSIISLDAIVKDRAWICAIIPFIFLSFVLINPMIPKRNYILVVSLLGASWFCHQSYMSTEKKESIKNEFKILKTKTDTTILIGDPFTSTIDPMRLKDNYVDTYSIGWTTMMPNREHISYTKLVEKQIPIIIETTAFDDFCTTLQSSLQVHYNLYTTPNILHKTDNYIIFSLIE